MVGAKTENYICTFFFSIVYFFQFKESRLLETYIPIDDNPVEIF